LGCAFYMDKKQGVASECNTLKSLLKLNDLKRRKDRGYKYEHDADGCNILDHHYKQVLSLEFSGKLNLLDYCGRLNNISNENTGKKRNDRHDHTVGNKIEKVKELHTEDLYSVPCAVSEAGKKSNKNRTD